MQPADAKALSGLGFHDPPGLPLVAALLALEYADAERDRELRRWQDRLGLIADTLPSPVEGWLRHQFPALGALPDNSSAPLSTL